MMIFAFVVLVALVLLGVYVFIQLAKWPKLVAQKRGHRYVDAINILSWGGLLLTAGLAWLGALVWAHATPSDDAVAPAGALDDLVQQINDLQAQVKALKA